MIAPEALTARLARFAAHLTYEELPATARRQAARLVLDSLACQFGGQLSPLGKVATNMGRTFESRPESTVVGTTLSAAAPLAAYVNARAGSLLDADDTLTSVSHHGNSTVAAALAGAEAREADGRALITAVVAGFEVGARWSVALGSKALPLLAKEKSITRIAPSGPAVLAAAVAVAHVNGADEELVRHTLGMAGLYTPVPIYKWFQEARLPTSKARDSGWLALAGAMAYQVAASGVTAYQTILEGSASLWRSEGYEQANEALLLEDLGERWYILETTFKPWPCQKWMQQALSALADLLQEEALPAADIEQVTIHANALSSAPHFALTQPDQPIMCQFNYPHAVAMLLLRIPPGPRWFRPDTLDHRQVAELRERVRVIPSNTPVPPDLKDPDGLIRRIGAAVEVKTRRGQFEKARDTAYGDPWAPEGELSDEALVTKLHHMADGLVPDNPGWRRRLDELAGSVMESESVVNVRNWAPWLIPFNGV